ncbi:MAG: hypothetical protein AAFQ82_16345, partial [Myxococcota bacterium]
MTSLPELELPAQHTYEERPFPAAFDLSRVGAQWESTIRSTRESILAALALHGAVLLRGLELRGPDGLDQSNECSGRIR